ncbi:hypothetical protein Aple_001040 [Acrocarpospora pleiomorpha]|uniref:SMP-30/Gluconolactonase/LRE-like region domain-containing protein n=1 Tax=Acrocarpospora pleiomorpha TaxID=90975 RepID=A0A5M3XAI7_9ACTN|nr:hypothetical protein Aple_001040 [Acrocarpospora pleiomorpha]
MDSLRGRVSTLAGTTFDLGEKVGSVAPLAGGGFVAALEHRVVATDARGTLTAELTALDLPAHHRLNDGAVDPYGRFVFGSMNEHRDAADAALFRLDGTRLDVLRAGLTLSNGIDWSPDGRTIYFTDSVAKRVFAADYTEHGPLRNERIFAEWPGPGMPDGLAVDAEGQVWSAIWDGACLVRYAPDGNVAARVDLPAPRPTSLAFGGPRLDTLYVTSARVGLDEPTLARFPCSGAVLVSRPGVTGLITRRVHPSGEEN